MERLVDCRRRVNRLPLGAAALAGTSYPIDRERVARELGFEGTVHQFARRRRRPRFRDRIRSRRGARHGASVALLPRNSCCGRARASGSSICADRFCTGSSIMPQKKNPDVPELVRGKTGRVVGHLMSLLVLMKGQPLTYNKDNQEDKEPLFDTVDTLADSLAIMTDLVASGIGVERGAHARSPRARASPPRPISPTTWCARGCLSAMRTRPSRVRCGTPRARRLRPRRTCRSRNCARSPPCVRRRRVRGTHARRLGRQPQPSGGNGTGTGARGDRSRRARRCRIRAPDARGFGRLHRPRRARPRWPARSPRSRSCPRSSGS